jgi:hypothetical protein
MLVSSLCLLPLLLWLLLLLLQEVVAGPIAVQVQSLNLGDDSTGATCMGSQ